MENVKQLLTSYLELMEKGENAAGWKECSLLPQRCRAGRQDQAAVAINWTSGFLADWTIR